MKAGCGLKSKKCAHVYQYDQTIYGDDDDEFYIMRRCRRCKRIEVAATKPWRPTRAVCWRVNAELVFDMAKARRQRERQVG